MVILYKGKLGFIHRQANLRPNVYDKVFKPKMETQIDKGVSIIKTQNLDAAQQKADEIRDIAMSSMNKMN